MARIKGMRPGMKRKRSETNNNTGARNSNNNTNGSDIKSDEDVVIVPPAGFIFLCNKKTKPRCFEYQVFGLSMTQMKNVGKIKPGIKLFLFDYELRVLHGVYESVSEGKMDLEPRAFHGKYLAQVKFRIVRECFPVEEKYFKNTILENYGDGRLKLELSEQQVNKLMPLFRPLPVQASLSSSLTEPGKMMTLPNAAASPHPWLPQRMENDQYDNQNLSGFQSLQILPQNPPPLPHPHPQYQYQYQYQPTVAGAIVDHAYQQYSSSIQNPIGHLHHDPYSTSGHTLMTVQQPYPRHISEQEWVQLQNQTMALQANDYHHHHQQQLPLMSVQPPQPGHYSPHHHPIPTTWYHHQQLPLPYILTENLNPTNYPFMASSSITATNPNNINTISTIHPPYPSPPPPPSSPYGFPAELSYSFPTMHPPPSPSPSSLSLLPYVPASASAGNWVEPNPPPIISGMPLLPINVPISSLFSFVGENHQFIN